MNLNDIPSVAGAWGWNSLQHYAPNDYSEKADYLIQSCRSLARVLEKLSTEEPWRCATIHVWIAMTDIVNYVGNRSSDTFTNILLMEEIWLTTCYIQNPMKHGKFTISTGAGFLPSTVFHPLNVVLYFFRSFLFVT